MDALTIHIINVDGGGIVIALIMCFATGCALEEWGDYALALAKL